MTSLSELSLVDLMVRKALLKKLIKENSDDERVKEPKRQLSIIEAELKSRKDVEKSPNYEDEDGNLVVGLRSLRMTANTK